MTNLWSKQSLLQDFTVVWTEVVELHQLIFSHEEAEKKNLTP